jgi:exodeoxyribonuclease-3
VISFCADGIVSVKKGFFDWALEQDADVICVQDLRAPESALGSRTFNPDGYFSYFFDSIDGKSNGVAIYCRKLPKAIMTGLGLGEADGEGRFMQADFENIGVACLLGPQASADPVPSPEITLFERLRGQLDKVRKKRRRYTCADIAHTAGVQRAAYRYPGFLGAERQWLVLFGGWVALMRSRPSTRWRRFSCGGRRDSAVG